MIKKYFTIFLMASLFAVAIPTMAGTASAQSRNDRQDDRYYEDDDDDYYETENRRPKVYDRHRKSINIGVAAGVGTVIGAIFGGKKGALIGAAAGVAGGAIITKKQRPRNTDRYRY